MPYAGESSHAKNVANFEAIISICISFKETYNPGKSTLQIAGLNALLEKIKDVMNRNRIAETAYNYATNNRAILFRQMKKLATQIVNAFDAHGASEETLKDARHFLNKMRGKRISAKPEEKNSTGPDGKTIKTISASQTGYISLLEHFQALVSLAVSEPTYQPNEETLSRPGLLAVLELYSQANTAVIDTHTALTLTRMKRNTLLYDKQTGAVTTAGKVKKYVKSLYGFSSPQYKELTPFQFRNRR